MFSSFTVKCIARVTLIAFIYSFVLHEPLMGVATLAEAGSEPVLSHRYGRVIEAEDRGGRTLIVYIQDLHCNPEVQNNIYRTIKFIGENANLTRIFVEGAPEGKLDLSLFGLVADKQLRARTAENMLRKGLLSGAEYYAVTEGKCGLYGLERWDAYLSNIERAKRLLISKGDSLKAVEKIAGRVEGITDKYQSRKLRRLGRLLLKADKDRKWYAILGWLCARTGEDITAYPNLRDYLLLLRAERTIRAGKVTKELSIYARQLKEVLPYPDFQLLSDKLRSPEGIDGYYLRLGELAREYTPGYERRYPELARFLEHARLNRGIDPVRLVGEERSLSERMLEKKAAGLTDGETLFLSRMTGYFRDFVGLSMTPGDYGYFKANADKYKILLRKYLPSEDPAMKDAFTLLGDRELYAFYDINLERNETFFKNIAVDAGAGAGSFQDRPRSLAGSLGRFDEVHIVVTGGFHAGITSFLKKNGSSYMVIFPGMVREHDNRVYEKILTCTLSAGEIMRSSIAPPLESLLTAGNGLPPETARQYAQNFVLSLLQSSDGSKFSEKEIVKIVHGFKRIAGKGTGKPLDISIAFKGPRCSLRIGDETFEFTVKDGQVTEYRGKSVKERVRKTVSLRDRIIQTAAVAISVSVVFSFVWLSVEFGWWTLGSDLVPITIFNVFRFVILGSLLLRYSLASFAYRPFPDKGYSPKISVLIPAYNEEDCIKSTIDTALRTGYPLDKLGLITVNDGSADKTLEIMRETAARYPPGLVKVLDQGTNQGKHKAIIRGVREATGEIVVFIDSDSFPDAGSIYKLVQPFADPRNKAVSGRVRARNYDKNALTKLQDVWYYTMFREKAADSIFGTVGCAPGCFSAFRREDVAGILPQLESLKVTTAEDRTITNLILEKGGRVVYQSNATASTIVPEKLDQFRKQQIRWQRSWAYEGLFRASRFMWKKNPVAAFMFYTSIVLPYVTPVIITSVVLWETLVLNIPPWGMIYGMVVASVIACFYYLYKEKKPHFLHYLLYSYMEVLLIHPMAYYALFTMKKNIWGTRKISAPKAPRKKPGFLQRIGKAFESLGAARKTIPVNGNGLALWKRMLIVSQILLISLPFTVSAAALYDTYANRVAKQSYDYTSYASDALYQVPGAAIRVDQVPGWRLSPNWYVDSAWQGAWPSAKNALTAEGGGTAYSDAVPVEYGKRYVLKGMMDVARYESGRITVSIEEGVMENGTFKALGTVEAAVADGEDLVSMFHEYTPARTGATVARVVISAGEGARLTAYFDEIEFCAVKSMPAPRLVFTFDDGWGSQLRAAEILEEHDMRGVYNIITEFTSERSGYEEYMSWDEIKALQSRGNQIGAHSRTHDGDITHMSPEMLASEIVGSKKDLMERGITPTVYASPYSEYNDPDERLVMRTYRSHRIGWEAPIGPLVDPYDLSVGGSDLNAEDAIKVIDAAIEEGGTTVLLFHRLENSEEDVLDPTQTTLESFRKIVEYADSRKDSISVVTLDELLDEQERNLENILPNPSFGSMATVLPAPTAVPTPTPTPAPTLAVDGRPVQVSVSRAEGSPLPADIASYPANGGIAEYGLRSRMIKTPSFFLPASRGFSQNIDVSTRGEGSLDPAALAGSEFYIIDGKSDIVWLGALPGAYTLDPLSGERVYRVNIGLEKTGTYRFVVKAGGKFIVSDPFDVTDGIPAEDALAVAGSFANRRSTEYPDLPRRVTYGSDTFAPGAVNDSMPGIVLDEGNLWSFVKHASKYINQHLSAMRYLPFSGEAESLANDQAFYLLDWMYAMQCHEGPMMGSVAEIESNGKLTGLGVKLETSGARRVSGGGESNFSTVTTSMYSAAMGQLFRSSFESGDRERMTKSLEAQLQGYYFVDRYYTNNPGAAAVDWSPEISGVPRGGYREDDRDIDERMLSAIMLLRSYYLDPVLFDETAGKYGLNPDIASVAGFVKDNYARLHVADFYNNETGNSDLTAASELAFAEDGFIDVFDLGAVREQARKDIVAYDDRLLEYAGLNPKGLAVSGEVRSMWGSSARMAENGVSLLRAYQAHYLSSGGYRSDYLDAAMTIWNYLAYGTGQDGVGYISGLGVSGGPKDLHDTLGYPPNGYTTEEQRKGQLVGGPTVFKSPENGILHYEDDYQAYWNNETGTESTTPASVLVSALSSYVQGPDEAILSAVQNEPDAPAPQQIIVREEEQPYEAQFAGSDRDGIDLDIVSKEAFKKGIISGAVFTVTAFFLHLLELTGITQILSVPLATISTGVLGAGILATFLLLAMAVARDPDDTTLGGGPSGRLPKDAVVFRAVRSGKDMKRLRGLSRGNPGIGIEFVDDIKGRHVTVDVPFEGKDLPAKVSVKKSGRLSVIHIALSGPGGERARQARGRAALKVIQESLEGVLRKDLGIKDKAMPICEMGDWGYIAPRSLEDRLTTDDALNGVTYVYEPSGRASPAESAAGKAAADAVDSAENPGYVKRISEIARYKAMLREAGPVPDGREMAAAVGLAALRDVTGREPPRRTGKIHDVESFYDMVSEGGMNTVYVTLDAPSTDGKTPLEIFIDWDREAKRTGKRVMPPSAADVREKITPAVIAEESRAALEAARACYGAADPSGQELRRYIGEVFERQLKETNDRIAAKGGRAVWGESEPASFAVLDASGVSGETVSDFREELRSVLVSAKGVIIHFGSGEAGGGFERIPLKGDGACGVAPCDLVSSIGKASRETGAGNETAICRKNRALGKLLVAAAGEELSGSETADGMRRTTAISVIRGNETVDIDGPWPRVLLAAYGCDTVYYEGKEVTFAALARILFDNARLPDGGRMYLILKNNLRELDKGNEAAYAGLVDGLFEEMNNRGFEPAYEADITENDFTQDPAHYKAIFSAS